MKGCGTYSKTTQNDVYLQALTAPREQRLHFQRDVNWGTKSRLFRTPVHASARSRVSPDAYSFRPLLFLFVIFLTISLPVLYFLTGKMNVSDKLFISPHGRLLKAWERRN